MFLLNYSLKLLLQWYIFYKVLCNVCNRPFLSNHNSHFENDAKCKTFLEKICFICMRIKNHFHINGLICT